MIFAQHELCSLVQDHESSFGESTQEISSFMFSNPPLNMRRSFAKENSGHDQIKADNVKEMMSFFHDVLKPGSQGQIFRGSFQYELRFIAFPGNNEKLEDSNDSGHCRNEINAFCKMALFEVESAQL